MEKEKSLIERLFDGEYAPFDSVKFPEPEYSETAKFIAEENEFFKTLFPAEFHERYDELNRKYMDLSYMENLAYYREGICVGLEIKKDIK